MRNGVPFDVAFSMADEMRAAAGIMFAEMEGAKFNVNTMRFEERKDG